METIEKKKCLRCSHEWWPVRPGNPVLCPFCKSKYWKTERPKPKKHNQKPE